MKDLSNVRVWGDLETEVNFAPLGSTLPTSLAPVTAPYQSIGWLSEDGVDLDLTAEVTKFKGYQGGTTLRTKVVSSEKSFKVQALEESPLVTGMFYGHGKPTLVGTGADAIARIDLPEAIPMIERAAVIHFVDNGVHKVLCCEKVQATERGTVSHKNTDMTVHEITFEIIGDAYILTNAPAYIEAAGD
ncbi:phage tail tube protein [Leucobacter chromiiresistens]